jgi:hypothetical protein
MATKAEKDFFDYIQGKIKKNYKYLGFSVYNLTADDIAKLKQLGDKWGIPFEWLCNLIAHESAGTFNPAIKNSIGATGLIQFLKSTAESLGTTTSALSALSFQGQLEWVDKYIDSNKSRYKNSGLIKDGKVNDNFQQPDLFMTIFYPSAIGKPNFQFPPEVSKANGGIKTPMDYARKALDHPPFPLDQVPSTLPEYRKKVSGEDVGTLPPGTPSNDTITAETPVVNTTPPNPPIPKIEEMSIKFNVEQKDIFKALNAKYNFGDLTVIQEVAEDEKFILTPEDTTGIDSEYTENVYTGPEEEFSIVNGEEIPVFNNAELQRDDNAPGEDGDGQGVQYGGSTVNSPSGSVSTSSVTLPADLAKVQNSSVITKKSMGNGYSAINTDITSPKGDKISGSDICRDMNQFVQDVLGPFATWLKSKYPNIYKGWYITSATRGYIPKGGSLTSQHMKGQAIDSQFLTSAKKGTLEFRENQLKLLNAILEWYQENPVGYGQILFETRDGTSCWIHWSYKRGNDRLMLARFKNDSTLKASMNKTGSYVKPPISSEAAALSAN